MRLRSTHGLPLRFVTHRLTTFGGYKHSFWVRDRRATFCASHNDFLSTIHATEGLCYPQLSTAQELAVRYTKTGKYYCCPSPSSQNMHSGSRVCSRPGLRYHKLLHFTHHNHLLLLINITISDGQSSFSLTDIIALLDHLPTELTTMTRIQVTIPWEQMPEVLAAENTQPVPGGPTDYRNSLLLT